MSTPSTPSSSPPRPLFTPSPVASPTRPLSTLSSPRPVASLDVDDPVDAPVEIPDEHAHETTSTEVGSALSLIASFD